MVDGKEVQQPFCCECGSQLDEIKIHGLQRWQKGWKYTRRYPFSEFAGLCPSCKIGQGFPDDEDYILVPKKQDQSYLEVLRAHLAEVSSVIPQSSR